MRSPVRPALMVRIQVLGSGFWVLGFGVWCLVFGVLGLGFGAWCVVFRVWGLEEDEAARLGL